MSPPLNKGIMSRLPDTPNYAGRDGKIKYGCGKLSEERIKFVCSG